MAHKFFKIYLKNNYNNIHLECENIFNKMLRKMFTMDIVI
jgi:hypothetical protein